MTAAPHNPLVVKVARALCGWRNGKRSPVPFDQSPKENRTPIAIKPKAPRRLPCGGTGHEALRQYMRTAPSTARRHGL